MSPSQKFGEHFQVDANQIMSRLAGEPVEVLERLVDNIELHIREAYGKLATDLVRSSPLSALCVHCFAVYASVNPEADAPPIGAVSEVRMEPEPIVWNGEKLSGDPIGMTRSDSPIAIPLSSGVAKEGGESLAHLRPSELQKILDQVHRYWFYRSDHGGAEDVLIVTGSGIYDNVHAGSVPSLIRSGASAAIIVSAMAGVFPRPTPTPQQAAAILEADGAIGTDVLMSKVFRQSDEVLDLIAAHKVRANGAGSARLKERMR